MRENTTDAFHMTRQNTFLSIVFFGLLPFGLYKFTIAEQVWLMCCCSSCLWAPLHLFVACKHIPYVLRGVANSGVGPSLVGSIFYPCILLRSSTVRVSRCCWSDVPIIL